MSEKIYALKLIEGKFYVGKSDIPLKRILAHLTGQGSVWTSKYKPVDIEEVRKSSSLFDEDNMTKEYMLKYGIDNVRGGNYTRINLDPLEIKSIQSELWGMQNLCRYCGKSNHFISDCPLYKSEQSSQKEKKEIQEIHIPVTEVQKVMIRKCPKCKKEYKTEAGYIKHKDKCNLGIKKDKSKTKCKKCGNIGHSAKGCVVGTDKEKEIVCFKCKESGHYASFCNK